MVSKRNKFIMLLGFIGFILITTACHRSTYIDDDKPKLPCKVQGACDATIAKYLNTLRKRGVHVETIGQDYLISLPASMLFYEQSPHMKWKAYKTLNLVANFLKQFRKIAITITSYSTSYVSVEREHALTIARSRVVSEYLWSQGVDSRFIFTQGMGTDKPIGSTGRAGDDSPNARVEITFRRAILN